MSDWNEKLQILSRSRTIPKLILGDSLFFPIAIFYLSEKNVDFLKVICKL